MEYYENDWDMYWDIVEACLQLLACDLIPYMLFTYTRAFMQQCPCGLMRYRFRLCIITFRVRHQLFLLCVEVAYRNINEPFTNVFLHSITR